MTALLPIALQYGIPAGIYLVGHLVGFIHGWFSKKKSIAKGGSPNVVNP